ncbi:down syndrome cell adhesion molecule-like protein Dscam2 [Trichonephila clavipes]|nr:down syndrome cell adhesion molecule-like protein Dscam2 [Trichonephila clavipes]
MEIVNRDAPDQDNGTKLLNSVLSNIHCAEEESGPRFRVEPPFRIEFSNSSGAEVRCSADGAPPLRISWQNREGANARDIPGIRYMRSDGTLVFPPFSREDYRQDVHDTLYQCLASNNVGAIISKETHVRGDLGTTQRKHLQKESIEERESIEDKPRSGRPSVSKTAENAVRVRDLVRSHRRLTVRMIGEELDSNHTTVLNRFLASKNIPVAPQPPYSPDLTPCDFFLFPKLKNHLKGHHFGTLKKIQTAVTDHLKAIPISECYQCYEEWKKPLQRCVASEGSYFEGDNVELKNCHSGHKDPQEDISRNRDESPSHVLPGHMSGVQTQIWARWTHPFIPSESQKRVPNLSVN